MKRNDPFRDGAFRGIVIGRTNADVSSTDGRSAKHERFSLSRWSRRKPKPRAGAAGGCRRTARRGRPPVHLRRPLRPARAEPVRCRRSSRSRSLPTSSRVPVGEGRRGDVKRAALRKLFTDPHFNVMDGLDIYIDDYSKPDPMPEGMLDKLADVYTTLRGSKRRRTR